MSDIVTRKTVEELQKLGLQYIDPTNFRFSNWEACWWSIFEDDDEQSYTKFMENIEKHMVGFARGQDLQCRPKDDMYAVMINIGEEDDLWFHINAVSFEMFFFDRERFYRIHENFTT